MSSIGNIVTAGLEVLAVTYVADRTLKAIKHLDKSNRSQPKKRTVPKKQQKKHTTKHETHHGLPEWEF